MMPTKDELLGQMGPADTRRVTARLRRFAYVPEKVLAGLAAEALSETWGNKLFVLEKYLAVQIGWSVEQERFTAADDQFYMSAGHLQTRYGTPLYLHFEPNRNPGRQPWCLSYAGSRVSAPTLPRPPQIPAAPEIPVGAEIVMSHDHILGDNEDRVAFLKDTPPVAQMCAVSGAIQWSLNRGLEIPYWYFGRMNYVVPLYLTSRENITQRPDLVAPVEVSSDQLLVRTVLLPHFPYGNARVAVERHDKLPAWMLDCWNQEAERMEEGTVEDPESESEPEG